MTKDRPGAEWGRRDLFRIVPLGLAVAKAQAGQHCAESSAPAAAQIPYRYSCFNSDEVQLLNQLTDRIIPADDHSPGALAAKVSEFADLMIGSGPDYVKDDWHGALHLVGEDLKTLSIDEWLALASQHEEDPQSAAEFFFRDLKRITIEGYYTSSTGIHDELRYQGNTYLAEFKGCNHPEHMPEIA